MPTKTAAGTADDGDEPKLTKEQREALMRAVATPELISSLQNFSKVTAGIVKQFSVSPGLLAIAEQSRRQQAQLARAMVPSMEATLGLQKMMEPITRSIAMQQQQWARQLSVSVLAGLDLQPKLAGLLVNSELTLAMQHISELARVRLQIPDEEGISRIRGLIDSGEVDEETLQAAEQSIAEDTELSDAIDVAAETLSRAKPIISRKRARQIIVFWVWLMWTAGLVAIAVAAPPTVAAIPGAAGLGGGPSAAKRVAKEFDKRYPPQDDPPQDEENEAP